MISVWYFFWSFSFSVRVNCEIYDHFQSNQALISSDLSTLGEKIALDSPKAGWR